MKLIKNIQKLGLGRAPPNTAPTSPVAAQLILQRWNIFSSWCYADCQQRSNERLVLLPQTRCSSFYGVKAFFRLGCMKLFKNVQSYGLAVLLEAQPSPFHDVKTLFRLDVMQPVKNLHVHGWAALPNSPCWRHIWRRWRIFSSWCYADNQQRSNERLVVLPHTWSSSFHNNEKVLVWLIWNFSKTFQIKAGPCSPKHGPHFFTVLNLFVWILCSNLNTIKFKAGPRSPLSPVTAQLISRRWVKFS